MSWYKKSFFKKADAELIEILKSSIKKHLLEENRKKSNDDLRSLIHEERYEEAAIIRDEIENNAEEIATNLAEDIDKEIDKIGIPYRFEDISAYGIAMNDFCVISNSVLNGSPAFIMFVMFHELGHLYQYRKYGNDFALYLYSNDFDKIEDDAKKLVWIEETANKFGKMKTSFYLRKYNLDISSMKFTGLSTNVDFYKSHLMRMKRMFRELPQERRNIREINDMLYNSIKFQAIGQ